MNSGARYLRAPLPTLRQTSDGNAMYPRRTNCAAATAYLNPMGAQIARPCLSTSNAKRGRMERANGALSAKVTTLGSKGALQKARPLGGDGEACYYSTMRNGRGRPRV